MPSEFADIIRWAKQEAARLNPAVYEYLLQFTAETVTIQAGAMSLGLEATIRQLYASGMSKEAIREVLRRDLHNGGPIFAPLTNGFKRSALQNIESVSNGVIKSVYETNLPETEVFAWVLDTRITNHCEDCLDRADREPMSMREWELIGLPQAGATVCDQNCGCKLEPVGVEKEQEKREAVEA